MSNTEYTDKPICIASREYQKKKLEEIKNSSLMDNEKQKLSDEITERSCICHHLGNGALINLGIADEADSPQSICPGPNLAWFDRTYSLEEMVGHIYGRGPSLVSADRIHMFAQEIIMYVDHFAKLMERCDNSSKKINVLKEYKTNLDKGMDL
ncbi:hypothetical protein ACFL5V_13805, partial [Fibrobacterota bacterium]